jgi:hypothetical protein
MSDHDFPLHAIDRLFGRFIAIYGAQKTATAWGNGDAHERALVWHQALSKYPMTVVGDALRDLAETGTGWPPTLPEFVQMVRDKVPPAAHRPALPVPDRRQADIEMGAQKAAALKAAVSTQKNPRAWAHKILERHAAGDTSLAPIAIQFAREALNKPAYGGDA